MPEHIQSIYQLIEEDSKQWIQDLINADFSNRDWVVILNSPFCQSEVEDGNFWAYEDKGEYSRKYAYKMT